MIIQAYGLEALVADKVFHLLLFKKTFPQTFHISLFSQMPYWENLTHMVRGTPMPTGEKAG